MAPWSDYINITQKMLSDDSLSPRVAEGDKGEGEHPIRAQVFCKRSQVEFMLHGVVLKDEHRTSNIERSTSNEKKNV